jgi:hypothetical protein
MNGSLLANFLYIRLLVEKINEFATMTSKIILHIIAIVMKVPQRLSAAYSNDQYINMLLMGGIEYILKRDFFDYYLLYCHDLKQ